MVAAARSIRSAFHRTVPAQFAPSAKCSVVWSSATESVPVAVLAPPLNVASCGRAEPQALVNVSEPPPVKGVAPTL